VNQRRTRCGEKVTTELAAWVGKQTRQ